MRWYTVFDYDFNNQAGWVVINKRLFHTDYQDIVGQDILLVSMEGDERTDEYDGFGTIVTVTGVRSAHSDAHIILETDLAHRMRPVT